MDPNKTREEIIERSQYCTVVNGKLNNVFSKTDKVLKFILPVCFPGAKAVGLDKIFHDITPRLKPKRLMARP